LERLEKSSGVPWRDYKKIVAYTWRDYRKKVEYTWREYRKKWSTLGEIIVKE